MRLRPTTRRHVAEAAAVAVATLHNWMSNRRLPPSHYVPVNVAVAAVLMALGRWGGATWAELGVDRSRLRDGVLAGVAGSTLTLAATAEAIQRPQLHHWFADERVLTLPPREALFQAVVRIPIGTAVAEELAFRGALTGLSLRQRSWPATAAWTSTLFGLWHVLPVIDTLAKNPVGQRAIEAGRPRVAAAAAVVGSGVAGVGFAQLRRLSGSVVAPILVHAVVNVAAFAAARHLHARLPPIAQPA